VLEVDREYACIFQLTDPATGTPTPRDCTSADYSVQEACDCSVTGLAPNSVPAVCGLANPGAPYASGTNDYTKQYFAKAYPTIREIQLVELMGNQGILSSLCPIHTSPQGGPSDPLFGYRPAVTAIVNRLKNALSTQCLPQQLSADTSGNVPCLVLATLADTPQNKVAFQSTVCANAKQGLSAATGDTELAILKTFQTSQHAAWLAPPNSMHGTDPSTLATCLVNQIPFTPNGSCATNGSGTEGWCYVTDTKFTGQCTQAVQFTPGAPPNGAVVSLQCIEANVNIVGGSTTSDGGGCGNSGG